MYTHTDYKAKKVSRTEYYSQFITSTTKEWVKRNIGMDALLNSKDEHFNDLPIKHIYRNGLSTWLWDKAPINVPLMIEAGECVNFPLPAYVTVVAKVCARQLVEEYRNKE